MTKKPHEDEESLTADADQAATDLAATVAAAVPAEGQTPLEAKKQVERDIQESQGSPVRRDANGALIL